MKYLLALALLASLSMSADAARRTRPDPVTSVPGTPIQPSAAVEKTLAGAACQKLTSFYWEIGDKDGKLVSGSVGGITENTVVSVDSSSKMIYAAYVLEKKSALKPEDTTYLDLQSGWSTFNPTSCTRRQTVKQCADMGKFDKTTLGYFDYGGGHMQVHAATMMNLADMDNLTLANEVNSVLGTKFAYSKAQLAGGALSTGRNYADFLRRTMNGELQLGKHLADNPVCTKCADSKNSPQTLAWHYTLGHWIEDDPAGDGAFSSPGARGTYPWISKDGKYYGVLAMDSSNFRVSSVCGAKMRKAFVTGIPQ